MVRKLLFVFVMIFSHLVITGCDPTIVADGSVIDTGGNTAPVINGSPGLTAHEGIQYRFAPTAIDIDGDVLTFSIQNKPGWLSFNQTTGELSGIPANSDIGLYSTIIITVSDGSATTSLPSFNLNVHMNSGGNSNTAPTISGSPALTVNEGEQYLFTPTAIDADNDTLTFSIHNKPSWLSFNQATGELSGVPMNIDIGMYSSIVITVSDGSATASLPGFDIDVQIAGNGNTTPTISGTPETTTRQGGQYQFIPIATDADNDTLTFSIQNKPSWLNFNQATGELSGTPATSDIGQYPSIVITVSDGTATASLAGFTLTVKSTSAVLSWVAPTAYTDETPLSMADIAGYKIYTGNSPTSLTELAVISDPYATSYEITNLSDGTHYFAVTVFITDMTESVLSTVVNKSI